ncbi:acyl-CoA dehydrogenase family protein [Brevundimonas sp.]|jgi:acyl-CoA dehydrogenase|uniref:acyl-CoA dehydrogenase family protein n=1 Tax=Brevundimonas sp. TaxID=1871086 RepID=UPI003782D57D
MAFLFDDDHRQIVQEAERVLSAGFSPERLRDLLETTGAVDDAFWSTCAEMGWTGIAIEEDHGGLGLGPIELGLTAQMAGRFAVGAPFLTTGFGVAEALRLHGTDDLKSAHLPGLADGSVIGAIWLTTAMESGALPTLAEGRLTGAIGPVAAGLQAGLLVTLARTPEGSDALVLIELDASTRRTAVQTFDNSRGYADLTFDGAPAIVLNGADAGAASLDLMARVAVIVAFEQLGIAEACLDRARTFANEREAFGQPIGKFQAIKHRIAEMYVTNELARGATLRAVLAVRDGTPDLIALAGAARLMAIDAAEFAAREAIQTHGAIGITWEHDLHLFYRRSRALALELGAPAAWQDVVAGRVIGAAA